MFHQELLGCLSSFSTATVIFNDTRSNDFNSLCSTIFSSPLMARKKVRPQMLPLLAPGSYYEQVLPAESVDIGVSMTSLHWLQCLQEPRTTPLTAEEISNAASHDLTCFLQLRHLELRPGGTLLLLFPLDGDLSFNPLFGAIKNAIHDVAGPLAAASYQVPVYIRQREEVDKVLQDQMADWQVIDRFEHDLEHQASSQIRSTASKNGLAFDQDCLVSSARMMCDWGLAIATSSIINTIRFFEKRSQKLDPTETQETDQELLERITEALFKRLLEIDWTQPIGSRSIYIKLQRTDSREQGLSPAKDRLKSH